MKKRAAIQIRVDNGFTLLELLTVIAIISIMVTIAVPNYIEWVHSSRLKSAAQTLMTDLSMTRMHAIKASDSTKVDVTILFPSSDYSIFDSIGKVLKESTFPSNISVTANTFTGNKAIFHKTGHMNAGSVTFSRSDGKSITIIVNAVGRIRLET